MDFKRQAGYFLCDHHHGPGEREKSSTEGYRESEAEQEAPGATLQVELHSPSEVRRVHAVVEDVDSSDLTQTQVAERHQQAVPEDRKATGHVTFDPRWAREHRPLSGSGGRSGYSGTLAAYALSC